MLTNNWRARMYYEVTGSSNQKYFKGIDGEQCGYNGHFGVNSSARIGTGTTEPKTTDYNLESEIDSTKYIESISVAADNTWDSTNGLSVVCNITNKSDENITFSEIGLFGNSYGTGAAVMMYARKVFDTPKILTPGETKTFALELF